MKKNYSIIGLGVFIIGGMSLFTGCGDSNGKTDKQITKSTDTSIETQNIEKPKNNIYNTASYKSGRACGLDRGCMFYIDHHEKYQIRKVYKEKGREGVKELLREDCKNLIKIAKMLKLNGSENINEEYYLEGFCDEVIIALKRYIKYNGYKIK